MAKLFQNGSAEDFENVLKLYPKAVEIKAKLKNKKKGESLQSLDKWMQEELRSAVLSRSPPHLVHSELVRLVEWKLARGKFRPKLIDLAGSNGEEEVVKVTGEALKLASQGKKEDAMKPLASLKGIGPATVSAVLAACCPAHFCFFADEVARTALALPPSGSLRYTAKEYSAVNEAVSLCAQRLDKEVGGGALWTPHRVELALWAYCVLEETSPHLLPSTSTSSPPTKKRKS